MKTIGLVMGAASAVEAIAFVLYLEVDPNVLHLGWVLSGGLMALGNHWAERSA